MAEKRQIKRKIGTRGIEAIAAALEQFQEVMGRPIEDGDRIMHWSYCYSHAEFKKLMIHSFLVADMPERLIYIYDQTGFAVGEEAYKNLSAAEKREIGRAAKRYSKLAKGKKPLFNIADYDLNHISLDGPFAQALYVLGNFIERHVNKSGRKLTEQEFLVAYLTVRAYRLLRAIHRSQSFSTSEECLILVRSLYEVYCKINFAMNSADDAQYLLDSDFGLASGEFEVAQKDGRPRPNFLVNKKTGAIIPRTKSFRTYIEASPFNGDVELYESLYSYLSTFVHSGSRLAIFTASKDLSGLDLTNENDETMGGFASIVATFIAATIMQRLTDYKEISPVSRWDIHLFCSMMRVLVLTDLEAGIVEIEPIIVGLKKRAEAFPEHAPATLSTN